MMYQGPGDAILQGIEMGQRFDQTADLERQRRELLAEREAMALLGQQPNFTGYENVPGATRPNWLRQMFANGSPESALKFEALAASPFAMQRDIQRSGEIERAKKLADQEVYNNLLTKFFPEQAGGAPGAAPQAASMPEGNVNAMTTALMPQPTMAGLSDQERSFELGPQGPKFSIKNPSPFERASKTEDLRIKGGGLKVQEGNLTREQNKDRDTAIQQAHDNVRLANDKILEVRRNMETGDLDMQTGKQAIAELQQQKQQFAAQRDALVRGQAPQAQDAVPEMASTSEAPTSMPSPSAPVTLAPKQRRELQQRELDPGVRQEARKQAEDRVARINDQIVAVEAKAHEGNLPAGHASKELAKLQQELQAATAQRDALVSGTAPVQTPAPAAAPSLMPSPRATTPVTQAEPAAPPQSALPGKMQQQADQKQLEEKRTLAGKEIVNAREHAQKLQQFKPQIKEIYDLVTRRSMGNPVVGNLPFGPTALSINRQNAQLKNLNEALTNMFAVPGQSQMMNTIIERQMQAAALPGLAVDPEQNKINAAVLRSNVEHLQQFPTFLERWQQTHGGTLDGATEAWIDYTEHNPAYLYASNKNGRVTVHENSHVVPLTRWLALRQSGRIRSINGRTFIQEEDRSWVEQ